MLDLEELKREILAHPSVRGATVEVVTYIEVVVVLLPRDKARRAWYQKEQELFQRYPEAGLDFREEEEKP